MQIQNKDQNEDQLLHRSPKKEARHNNTRTPHPSTHIHTNTNINTQTQINDVLVSTYKSYFI